MCATFSWYSWDVKAFSSVTSGVQWNIGQVSQASTVNCSFQNCYITFITLFNMFKDNAVYWNSRTYINRGPCWVFDKLKIRSTFILLFFAPSLSNVFHLHWFTQYSHWLAQTKPSMQWFKQFVSHFNGLKIVVCIQRSQLHDFNSRK